MISWGFKHRGHLVKAFVVVLEALWGGITIYHFTQKRANLTALLGLKQLDLVWKEAFMKSSMLWQFQHRVCGEGRWSTNKANLGSLAQGTNHSVVRGVGRGDSGELSVKEAKCRKGSKERLSGSAGWGGSCWRPGGETWALQTSLPILALSLIHWASHALLLVSFFLSVSDEIELACVHGSHPDSEIWKFHFCSLWHWVQMTKTDTVIPTTNVYNPESQILKSYS